MPAQMWDLRVLELELRGCREFGGCGLVVVIVNVGPDIFFHPHFFIDVALGRCETFKLIDQCCVSSQTRWTK